MICSNFRFFLVQIWLTTRSIIFYLWSNLSTDLHLKSKKSIASENLKHWGMNKIISNIKCMEAMMKARKIEILCFEFYIVSPDGKIIHKHFWIIWQNHFYICWRYICLKWANTQIISEYCWPYFAEVKSFASYVSDKVCMWCDISGWSWMDTAGVSPGRPHHGASTTACSQPSLPATVWCLTQTLPSCLPTTAIWASTSPFPCAEGERGGGHLWEDTPKNSVPIRSPQKLSPPGSHRQGALAEICRRAPIFPGHFHILDEM